MVTSARMATVVGIVLAVAALLADSWSWSGPVLVRLSASHGVHATDIPIAMAAAAAVGVVLLRGRPVAAPARVRR